MSLLHRRRVALFLFAVVILPLRNPRASMSDEPREVMKSWTVVVHGGGVRESDMREPGLGRVKESLRSALVAASKILDSGGEAIDAVETAVRILEDDPLFNAGRGSVANLAGDYELDASIMSGATRSAGGVAGVRTVKNPIAAARAVLEDGRHVLICGEGAEAFAKQREIEQVDPAYFFDEPMFEEIQLRRSAVGLPPLDHPSKRPSQGTVGAVALDRKGNLAAATSTGGLTAKLPGRIGDSPIIGAGTYAENGVVAASGTGAGEKYIINSATGQVAWFVKYLGLSVDQAVTKVMHEVLPAGAGGMIAVSAQGDPSMVVTMESMSCGYAKSDGSNETFVLTP